MGSGGEKRPLSSARGKGNETVLEKRKTPTCEKSFWYDDGNRRKRGGKARQRRREKKRRGRKRKRGKKDATRAPPVKKRSYFAPGPREKKREKPFSHNFSSTGGGKRGEKDKHPPDTKVEKKKREKGIHRPTSQSPEEKERGGEYTAENGKKEGQGPFSIDQWSRTEKKGKRTNEKRWSLWGKEKRKKKKSYTTPGPLPDEEKREKTRGKFLPGPLARRRKKRGKKRGLSYHAL